MKNISVNEMHKIQGGGPLHAMCFSVGFLTVLTISFSPLTTQIAAPVIKYCWDH